MTTSSDTHPIPEAACSSDERSQHAAQARGFAVTFDACAAVFLNEPCDRVINDVRRVAQVLGCTDFDGIQTSEANAPDTDALRQRFYDRTLVASSPRYVPLQESCIFGSAIEKDGSVRYNGVQSSRGDHVLRCYKTLGFDFCQLEGDSMPLKALRCDSLASELAFLAFMKNSEALSWENTADHEAAHWRELARRFAREHANAWFGTAAQRLAATGDDLYARTCAFAAQVVDVLVQEG